MAGIIPCSPAVYPSGSSCCCINHHDHGQCCSAASAVAISVLTSEVQRVVGLLTDVVGKLEAIRASSDETRQSVSRAGNELTAMRAVCDESGKSFVKAGSELAAIRVAASAVVEILTSLTSATKQAFAHFWSVPIVLFSKMFGSYAPCFYPVQTPSSSVVNQAVQSHKKLLKSITEAHP